MSGTTTIQTIAKRLEAWAPLASSEAYDNSGLQLGRPSTPVTKGLIALDLTPEVVTEARGRGAQLVITHHPLFFAPIKAITPDTLVGAMALELVEAGIAHYAIHTNLDAAQGGVSYALARRLGLEDVTFLKPADDKAQRTGMGAMGRLPQAISVGDFLGLLCEALEIPALRHVSRTSASIHSVAVCGGSGSTLLQEAIACGADAYVTADVKYHQFFDALSPEGDPRITYVDVGHYESEAVTEELLVTYLQAQFPQIQWRRTESRTGPVRSFLRP